MSTNSNCDIVQVKADEWFYVLEHRHAPKNAWDWRENATAYGPFPTVDAAILHLDENHANPGGWCETALATGTTELDLRDDEVLCQLIAEARKNPPQQRSAWRFR